jgi:Cu/Ag efflux protein CusF
MKRYMTISTLLASALFLLGVTAAQAKEEKLPAGFAGAESVIVTATVTAIDLKTRRVTLRGPEGNTVTLTVGEQARNLPQVKVGDRVDVEYFQALAVKLKPTTSGMQERSDVTAATRAPEGGMPGGAIVNTVHFVATVQAVDKKARLVTVRGAKQTVELKVSDDVDLRRVKVGDTVEGTYMEGFAVAVTSEGVPQEEPNATVEIKQWQVGFILGGGGGSGELHFKGRTYPLEISGVNLGATVGITKADLVGEAYNLKTPENIDGAYGQAGASVAFVGGEKVWTLKNRTTGVLLRLHGKQKGLELALNVGGMNISLKK